MSCPLIGVSNGEVELLTRSAMGLGLVFLIAGCGEDNTASSGDTGGNNEPDRMLVVPAGMYTMGDGGTGCGMDERQVTLTRSFLLGQYHVTNREYLDALQWAYDNSYAVVESTWVVDALDGSVEHLLWLGGPGSEIGFTAGTFALRDVGHGASNGDHPVKEVTWYGAVAYCDWRSTMEGLSRAYDHSTWLCNGGDPYGAAGYRLPTDAEWEFAAQYDDERLYPWGNEPPTPARANYDFNVGWTTPVGSYPGAPSIGGELLYDMLGNVGDWCNDWHVCSLGTAPAVDPVGPSTGQWRVFRGSSFGSGAGRNAGRREDFALPELPSTFLGFRVARAH